MGAGSLEMNTAGLQLVDEEPIRLDVKIAIADPVGFQWVVAKPGRQRSVIDKPRQNVALSIPRFSASFTSRLKRPE